MSSTDTRHLIEAAVDHFLDEVPALRQLKLVIRLHLAARGDAPTWRVELPGPKVSRDPASEARLDLTIQRARFNELAEAGTVKLWSDAYRRGDVDASGEPAIVKLIGSVIERSLIRAH